MGKINVVNVKCGGCANTIKNELEKIGIKNIKVSFTENDTKENRVIEFEGNHDLVKNKLLYLGYPEIGSRQADELLKKAKSFISCALGKM